MVSSVFASELFLFVILTSKMAGKFKSRESRQERIPDGAIKNPSGQAHSGELRPDET